MLLKSRDVCPRTLLARGDSVSQRECVVVSADDDDDDDDADDVSPQNVRDDRTQSHATNPNIEAHKHRHKHIYICYKVL